MKDIYRNQRNFQSPSSNPAALEHLHGSELSFHLWKVQEALSTLQNEPHNFLGPSYMQVIQFLLSCGQAQFLSEAEEQNQILPAWAGSHCSESGRFSSGSIISIFTCVLLLVCSGLLWLEHKHSKHKHSKHKYSKSSSIVKDVTVRQCFRLTYKLLRLHIYNSFDLVFFQYQREAGCKIVWKNLGSCKQRSDVSFTSTFFAVWLGYKTSNSSESFSEQVGFFLDWKHNLGTKSSLQCMAMHRIILLSQWGPFIRSYSIEKREDRFGYP